MEQSSSASPVIPTVANITTTISTSTISTATTSSATATTTTTSASASTVVAPIQQLKIYDFRKDQDYIQLLMKDLEKLDPDKNGLKTVPKEITSSTLTTRLRGVCKINRLIEHANDMCLSFNELGSNKHSEHIEKLREWILKNKIIEHIFGPNCHVEIIKQSHTILNFVAFSLDNEHVNVIWSASSLKHCGRQVLDLLTSLIRSMRAGPVLHLYWLIRNLNVEEHTEHTLLLTSHVLRFIWSHSPCINQMEFCSIQKDHPPQSPSHSLVESENNQHAFGKQYIRHHDIKQQKRYPYTNLSRSISLQHRYKSLQQRTKQSSHNVRKTNTSPTNQYHRDSIINDDERSINSNENIACITGKSSALENASTSSVNENSAPPDNEYVSLMSHDDMQWYTECVSQSRQNADEHSVNSSQSSDNSSQEKSLDQTLIDAIKRAADNRNSVSQRRFQRQNSPADSDVDGNGADASDDQGDGGDIDDVGDEVEGGDARIHWLDCGTKKYHADDDVEQNFENASNSNKFKESLPLNGSSLDVQQKSNQSLEAYVHGTSDGQFNVTAADEEEWLEQMREDDADFIDFVSDVSVCCSEEKNMGDFDDESLDFFQDENIIYENHDDPSANLSDTLVEVGEEIEKSRRSALETLKASQKTSNKEFFDSGSTTRDSEGDKVSIDPSIENLQQISHESVTQFIELKNASMNLTNITSQICADEDLKKLSEYNLANLAEKGKTLLWDLLKDEKIDHLAPNLHMEVENVLVNLVMSFGDRYIRYRFIEACLENLSSGTSVIISLRLLPRFMSFNTMTRSLSLPAVNETYTIVLWAEREHNMSKNFFKNLVEYHKSRQCKSKDEISTSTKKDESQEDVSKDQFFSHLDAIITRMSFLTFIYSKPFSPVSMRLDKEQMDQLWDCLASDDTSRCSDVLFQWIYQQAIGEDFHGVDDELLDYILKHKLPKLCPEQFRLRGLKLLEQLLWIRQDYECCHELDNPATRLLWDIALKAVDDEVSLAAIRILNHFYIYNNHQKPITCKQRTNFMRYCMEHLQSSLLALKSSSEQSDINQSLDVMHRVLLLIRTHLEVFKAHWSYYLRTLQLNSEADLTSHRLSAYDIKLTMTIRLVCQAASSTAKTTIEVQANDFMGELRAEIVKWWYSQVDRGFYEQSAQFSPTSSIDSPSISTAGQGNNGEQQSNNPETTETTTTNCRSKIDNFTQFLLNNHHSLRLLSLNQEIPFDWDERQINELDFKDMQVIYVLNDVRRTAAVDSADELDSNNSTDERTVQTLQYPTIHSIPSIVLQSQENFELLMDTDKYLGSFKGHNLDTAGRSKALSRRVWEIIQILPTSPHYKRDIKRCGSSEDKDADWTLKVPFCAHLMSAECPQRLLYALQIIDILRSSHENPYWPVTFIRKGGLSDLYDVFMSQKLLPDDNEDWNEWLQECLAYLLKLLFEFGTKPITPPGSYEYPASSSSSAGKHQVSSPYGRSATASSAKRMRRNRYRVVGSAEDRVMIPMFSDELLSLLESTDSIFDKLMRILKSSALCRSQNDQYYYVTMSSRAMIVHHVMSFLSSWCKSDQKFPKIQVQDYERLLKALILDDTDPSSRREACGGFLKLHYACVTRFLDGSNMDSSTSTTGSDSPMSEGGASNNSTSEQNASNGLANIQVPNLTFSADLLSCLVKFLPIAESMKPPRSIRNCLSESEYIRELNSPGCKDYFWLTCRLIDAPNTCCQKMNNANNRGETHEHQDEIESNSPEGDQNESNDQTVRTLKISSPIDLHELCNYLVYAIRRRPVFETRDFSVEDDALRGMLLMMVMAIRRDPTFRYTELAGQFILELYSYLFAAPTEKCRYLPKCKSGPTRSTAFDLMLGLVECCPKNYMTLLAQLLKDQHQAVMKVTHPSEYWPHDDCRSEVGFVGLINLGATCYLATCMQHLFMIPDLRYAILSIRDTKNLRHGDILQELQKIFAFLLESERKAYNPRNFCKVYTMDNHPLNIAEQTDMTEFLTDLITKLEESSSGLRQIIKSLFSGTLSNNVVSLDCPHISRTTEEFYTLRVQVADMRNLNDSLDELTVKDTLEGDNMYTCSTCEKKVRAEKRACIVKLPRILCFNTMRYTFNMATMTKEKVNTHFSFPLKLDMADYLESNLMKRQQSPTNTSHHGSTSSRDSFSSRSSSPHGGENYNYDTCNKQDQAEATSKRPEQIQPQTGFESSEETSDPETLYELIGVTVHTGNADGGHYYCFIRDCEDQTSDKPKWYLFNDAEVKPFDDSHIGTECYGGELTTKSYDAINDRFMDFSIEKTNSAYMLFYKRADYKYRSKSVAVRYLESDSERYLTEFFSDTFKRNGEKVHECSSHNIAISSHPSSPDACKSIATPEFKANQVETSFSEDNISGEINFDHMCSMTYNDFVLPRYLANWIWNDNLRFSRDQFIFEHNYFDFIWQICANVSRTLATGQKNLVGIFPEAYFQVPEDTIAIETVHLSIIFVLGVLMNSRERPNLSNWTELIRKQFNSSRASCYWLMQLADDEDTWLKQLIQRCPIEMVRQLFQRLCSDLTGINKQHKKLRLVK